MGGRSQNGTLITNGAQGVKENKGEHEMERRKTGSEKKNPYK